MKVLLSFFHIALSSCSPSTEFVQAEEGKGRQRRKGIKSIKKIKSIKSKIERINQYEEGRSCGREGNESLSIDRQV